MSRGEGEGVASITGGGDDAPEPAAVANDPLIRELMVTFFGGVEVCAQCDRLVGKDRPLGCIDTNAGIRRGWRERDEFSGCQQPADVNGRRVNALVSNRDTGRVTGRSLHKPVGAGNCPYGV